MPCSQDGIAIEHVRMIEMATRWSTSPSPSALRRTKQPAGSETCYSRAYWQTRSAPSIQQELLHTCMLSGRRGRQLSDLVAEVRPVRAGPKDLWHGEVQQSLQLRFGRGEKGGGEADERAAITTEPSDQQQSLPVVGRS
jgi:hypothetical protein